MWKGAKDMPVLENLRELLYGDMQAETKAAPHIQVNPTLIVDFNRKVSLVYKGKDGLKTEEFPTVEEAIGSQDKERRRGWTILKFEHGEAMSHFIPEWREE